MPKYFSNKAEQLHAEAFTTLLLIEDKYFNQQIPVSLVIRARNRVYRRWERAYGKK